jgi:DNA-binding MarR family transcriptional regulator
MSKRPAKSDRAVDLPDWADDVTPADEVMKKFYAPTGTFKRGPIAVTGTSEPAESPETITADSAQIQQKEEDAAVAETPAPTPTASSEKQQREPSRATAPPAVRPSAQFPITPSRDSLPPAQPTSTASTTAASAATSAARSDASPPAANVAESTSFEDFARKWRMYLYPGQLSVMRRLYELTYAVGATECFTRYSELAKATNMSRRNCINVVNSLVDRGFIERLEVKNDATGKGIRLRVYLTPRP